MKKAIIFPLTVVVELLFLPMLLLLSVASRIYSHRRIDVGLGPYPLVNNVYHKRALERQGFSVESFVYSVYYITNDFDIVLSEKYNVSTLYGKSRALVDLALLPYRYRILYLYFNGGVYGATKVLWLFEPFLYKIAGIKTVIMPYGSDVQDMTRCNNYLFKDALFRSYPDHKRSRLKIFTKVQLWSVHGDHVISGCDWVDYMFHWDTLMLAHFSIDTEEGYHKPDSTISADRETFRILHAPNHRAIKGTDYLIDAASQLVEEGFDIELVLLERVSNDMVIREIQNVDLVADQFIIGWYAMFAIEAMKHGKPVLCYLRDDLTDLYESVGLIQNGEIPIIKTGYKDIRDNILHAYHNRSELAVIGERSREYVRKHHSLESVGAVFKKINDDLLE